MTGWASTAALGGGLGLKSMKYRADLISANFSRSPARRAVPESSANWHTN
jgi:signal transduction histidine kinase